MNTFLWSCAALLTLFVTAESLTCNTCEVTFLGTCFGKTPVNCTKTQDRCYTADATFSSAELSSIHERGCTEASTCTPTKQTGSILNINYTITKTCCNTTLCNGASSVQLPLTAALGAALVATWSQWGL